MKTRHCVGLEIGKTEDLALNMLSMNKGGKIIFSHHLLKTKNVFIIVLVLTNPKSNALI